MKTLIIASCCFFASLALTGTGSADPRHDRGDHHSDARPERGDAHRDRDRDYEGHRGYRDHPYEADRHYDHYRYRERNYGYRGHWQSWNAWNDYVRQHPWMREHGRYYREGAHLMFRFCDPNTGGCFFFSIGR